MHYPNLTAEYEASGYHISVLAEAANVTPELMHHALYGEEDLTVSELRALHRILGVRCSIHYTMAPTLATLDPHKAKTRYRAAQLRQLLQRADAFDCTMLWDFHRRELARTVCASMLAAEAVSYAAYRHSVRGLELLIAVYTQRVPRGRRAVA